MEERGRALATYVGAATERPFRWGEHDCALFAAGWMTVLTGRDPAAALRGTYSDAAGAGGVVGEDPEAWFAGMATAHGLVAIEPRFARRGDVCLLDYGDGPALGICTGAEMVLPAQPYGLARFRLSRARRAWRIA